SSRSRISAWARCVGDNHNVWPGRTFSMVSRSASRYDDNSSVVFPLPATPASTSMQGSMLRIVRDRAGNGIAGLDRIRRCVYSPAPSQSLFNRPSPNFLAAPSPAAKRLRAEEPFDYGARTPTVLVLDADLRGRRLPEAEFAVAEPR